MKSFAGVAAVSLSATLSAPSLPLRQYSLVARCKGAGSADDAASFECRAGF